MLCDCVIYILYFLVFFFFFKQKTAYEVRISDWSSDVCSSDLTLGGTFDMPHAQTHTAVLPHAIAYNAPSVPEAMERASRALGGGDPATKLYELAVGLGAEMSLAKLGMPKDGIAKAAALAVANPYPN